MTDLLSDVETPSDAELISRVRGGDVAAYGDLFSRHKDAANRLARQLVRGPDSDDLVSEAFAKVLSVLQGGGGPDVAFRAYLLTAVRRLHVDRVRSGQRLQTTDDMTPFDPGVPFQDTAVAGFESGAAAKAFASLPERWQLVLWHLEVEGQKPADIAPLLGMSANSVSALAYRAREGLRQAFLTMHIADLTDTDCRWVNEHLGAFIRKGLSQRDSAKVQSHLDECRRCTAMYLELTEVNSNLAGIIAPLLLGAAASGYLASSGAGAAGVLGLLSRAKDFVAANTGAVTAAGVAAAVATAAAVAAVTLSGGGPKNVVADPPAAVTTPAAPAPSVATKTPAKTRATTPATTPGKPAAVTTAPVGPVATPAQTPAAPVTDFTNVIPSLPGSPSATDSAGTGTDVTAPSSVDLSGTTIDDRGVHFRAVGSPALPPTLTVRLLSDPGGVVFTQAGNDCAVSDNGLSAVCSTISGSGARSPGTAKMLASSSYSAELPFDQDAGPDNADVSIAIAPLPDGFELSGADGSVASHHFVRPAKVRQVDAAFDLDAARVRPAADDRYTVDGTLALSGPSAPSLSTVTYTVTGGTFGNGATTASRSTDATPQFVVVPDAKRNPDVAIRVAVPAAFTDTVPGNDRAAAHLAPYDVRLTGLTATSGHATPAGDQTFTATLDADGFPTPADLVLSLAAPSTDTLMSTDRTGDTVTFIVRSTSPDAHALTFLASLPTGFTNASDGNRTTGTWTPAVVVEPAADLDLTLDGPVAADPDGGYTVTGHLTGVPTGYPGTVTYSLSGAPATFVSVGCTPLGQTLLCPVPADGTVVFDVDANDNTVANQITVTVAHLTGYTDPDETNNVAPTTLQAVVPPSTDVDVALTGLTPGTVRPDKDDTYSVSGSLSVTGPAAAKVENVTYTVSGAQFVTAGGPTNAVTFPASTTSPAFTLAHQGAGTATITATAAGFTETDPGDNASSVALKPYDVSLGALTAATGSADQGGDQKFTAPVDTDGFTAGQLVYSLVGPADLSMTHSVTGGTATFTVHSALKDQKPAGFTVRADLPSGYTDYDTTDNSRAGTYTYATTPVETFAFDGAPTATGGSSSTSWNVTATLKGIPVAATHVAVTLPSNQERFTGTSTTGCTIANETLTCATGGATRITVTFQARLPGNSDPARNGIVATAGGQTASSTITFN